MAPVDLLSVFNETPTWPTVAIAVVAVGIALLLTRAAAAHAARTRCDKAIRDWTPSNHERLAKLHVVVLVNPNAGSGRGEKVFRDVVHPMLSRNRIAHTVHRTTGTGHAHSICAELKPTHQAGFTTLVLVVSGDGMVHEALNGLLQHTRASTLPRTHAVLAVLPAGSGNGVAASLYGRSAARDVARTLIRILDGAPQPVDVMAMRYLDGPMVGGAVGETEHAQTPKRTRRRASSSSSSSSLPPPEDEKDAMIRYDLHFVCWAIFADHDYLVEGPLRRLGPLLKLALAPLVVLLRMRMHRGTCDLHPVAPAAADAHAYSDPSALPPSPDDASMVRLEGDFLCWALGNLPESGNDSSATPFARQSDGTADLLCCRRSATLGRSALFRLFDRMSSGTHIPDAHLEYYKTDRLVLRSESAIDHLQMSGQEMRKGPVEVVVHRAAVNVMM
jgi:diacylglycerol kinase family enzyme